MTKKLHGNEETDASDGNIFLLANSRKPVDTLNRLLQKHSKKDASSKKTSKEKQNVDDSPNKKPKQTTARRKTTKRDPNEPPKKRGRKPKSEKKEIVQQEKQDANSGRYTIVITIDFGNIERIKKERRSYTKSIYSSYKELPYDNDDLPPVRFPITYCTPDHLLKEFKNMFPESPDHRGGKIGLVPSRKLDDGKSKELLIWLVNCHWKNVNNLDMLAKILLHKLNITLTHLDWLCTNYSKSYDVRYRKNPNNPIEFNVHDSYNQNLKLHVRAYFDVFARSIRVLVEWETRDEEMFNSFTKYKPNNMDIKWDNKMNVGMRRVGDKMMVYLITSVGQLNFFAWAMSSGVIKYCIDNADDIYRDYVEKVQDTPSPGNKKRRRLSEPPPSSLKMRRIETLVQPNDTDIQNIVSQVCINLFPPRGEGNRVIQETEFE